MREMKNELNSMLKGAIYGLVASIILLIIVSSVLLTYDYSEQTILITSVGFTIWGITWTIAGAIISIAGLKTSRWKLIGFLCGVLIGVVSATLVIVWPNCNYENVIDKVRGAVPYAIEMPAFSLFIPLTMLTQHYIDGWLVAYSLLIISSVLMWGAFGAVLGKLVGREPKVNLP